MKKIPLAIAMVSLLAASTSFATQYYNQDYQVSLDIPSSIDVSEFQQGVIKLSMEDFNSENNSDGVLIGSMNIETNSGRCTASITTANNFNLVGPSGKLPYMLNYIANDYGSSSALYGSSNNTRINTQFSSDDTTSQEVGCDSADLKMLLSGANDIESLDGNMKAGAYNDVIRVEVRAD